MTMETYYYKWTIIEAWDWLVDLPMLGFALLILVGAYILLRIVIAMFKLAIFLG